MADILAEAEVEANLEEGVVDDSVVVEEESDKVNEPHTEEAAEEKEEVLPGKNLHVRNLSLKVSVVLNLRFFLKAVLLGYRRDSEGSLQSSWRNIVG